MAKRSWKANPIIVPRFVQAAVRKGLRLADSIGIEEANDKSWLRIAFKKRQEAKSPRRGEAIDLYPDFKAVRIALDKAQNQYECRESFSVYRAQIAALVAKVESLESNADLNREAVTR